MTRTVYDEVRYSNFPYAQTHPGRLATVATLHGMAPPDPFTGRVLEVGCGAGGNLLALAAATPGVHALGIDLAATAIDEATEIARSSGLSNVSFAVGDVRNLTDGQLGTFDYIVAHGLYAWVPADAREALLALIASHLSENGLAYVSYNAHPGGHFRRMLREMGEWYARDVSDPVDRAVKARDLYRFLRDQRMTEADVYGAVLERELPALSDAPIWRLVHDDLSEFWEPVWFADFMTHAGAHGLGYVGEADLYGLRTEVQIPGGVEDDAWAFVGGDRTAFEQLTDILTNRHFRQSVLCREDAGAVVQATPSPAAAAGLWWAAREAAEGVPDAGVAREAFLELDRERPHSLAFAELLDRLGCGAAELGEALIAGVRSEHLLPHAGPLSGAADAGERPVASPLARYQASRGSDITSLTYATIHMEEPAARLLITLLDGTRDRAAIRAELHSRTGLELTEEDLDNNLRELAKLFLLEA
jgi:SAM-dependent methyltransferase